MSGATVATDSHLTEELLHNLGDGVFCMDPGGVCFFANPVAQHLLGFGHGELLGHSGHDLFECGVGQFRNGCDCAVFQTMRDGVRRQSEIRLLRKDGVLLPAQLTVAPLSRADGGHSVVVVFRDNSERLRQEEERESRTARLREQNRLLVHIAACEAVSLGEVERVAREITQQVARTFQVDRVGVWLFNAQENALRCISLYHAEDGRHQQGEILLEPHFGPEFEALRNARYVASTDAMTEPYLAGYREDYLRPNGILSMLDCAILSGGRVLGMLCLEYIHRIHAWSEDEIAFGCALADQIGMAILNLERARAESELRLSEARHRAISGLTSDLLFSCMRSMNQDYSLDWMTGSCEAIFGVSQEEMMHRGCWRCFVHPEDGDIFRLLVTDLKPGESGRGELRIIRADGETRHVQVYTKLEPDEMEGAHRLFGACRDITERKSLERELLRLAHTDPLTGVANRRRFMDQLELELERRHRSGEPLSVLILDVDHFKKVNDRHGHAMGDSALRHLAELGQGLLRRNDLFGRLGGEEFGILLPGAALAGALEFAERYRQHVEDQPAPGGLSLTISVGVTECLPEDINADQPLARADQALYRAKQGGRNRVESG